MVLQHFDDLKKLQKGYDRLLEPICQRWALTRNEMDVVLFLYNNPSLDRAADIVSCRGIAKSHVSQSVASLEKRGFLGKQTDEADRRTVHLKLTAAALPAAQAGKAAQQDLGRRLLRDFSAEELELWWALWDRVRRNIETLEE